MLTRGTHNTLHGRARFQPLADVIGWQEVNDDAAREKLARSLPGYHHHIPDEEWAGALPISWLADRHELVSVGQRKAHDGRAKVSPARGVVWAVLKDLATGVTTAHVNTHFVSRAWSKGVVVARPWRQEQWAQHLVVLNEVVQDFRGRGLPVVVGGDFNRHEPVKMPGMVNASDAKRPPYDQIIYSEPMPFVGLTRGPRFGSDHFSFVAEFKGEPVTTPPVRPDPLERITFRGKTLDRKTAAALAIAERRLGYELTITQGSYNPGGVGASGGTHDRGGVVDLAAFDAARKVRVLRSLGFAAWHRLPSQGPWVEHVHAVLAGHEDLSPAAAAQVVAYRNGRNGLANNAPDPNTFRPDVTFDYNAAWRDDLLRGRISGIQARIDALRDRASALRQKITYKGGVAK
jgi:hypothetical protein